MEETYSIKINKIYEENRHLFPKKLSKNINEAELLKWIARRKAPKNRQFVEKILSAIDDNDNPMKYVDVSHALSLNDAYWITNDIERHLPKLRKLLNFEFKKHSKFNISDATLKVMFKFIQERSKTIIALYQQKVSVTKNASKI